MTRRTTLANGNTLTATAILHKIGEQSPYFSLTGEEWNPKRRGDHIEACGQMHDDILAQWPDMADLAALHLSDMDGVPMHAVENGWYWAGGTQWTEGVPSTLASHLRIAPETAEDLCKAVRGGMEKEAFRAIVNEMRPRWKEEADAAIAKYALTITER